MVDPMDTVTPAPTTAIPRPAPTADERLSELLDAELAYDPVARGGFINHTAMALAAAWRLGATTEELDALYHDDVTSDFLIGRREPSGLMAVRRDVESVGVEAAVRRAAPALVSSPGSQFFHAVIRLEYGLDVAHTAQVANALHNWAHHGEPMADLPTPRGDRAFVDVARDLVASPDTGGVRLGRLGDTVSRDMGSTSWFADALAEADLDAPGLLDEVASVALAAHVAGANIGSLHLVTGTRATRVVAPLLAAPLARELTARIAQAVAAGLWAAKGSLPEEAELDDLRSQPMPAWDDIARAAIDTGDHHVIKLTYTSLRETQVTDDPLYRWVAAREAGLV
ncbi:hypothetical protein BH23ACT2_BH23ACT2_09050 [soil metagenome]